MNIYDIPEFQWGSEWHVYNTTPEVVVRETIRLGRKYPEALRLILSVQPVHLWDFEGMPDTAIGLARVLQTCNDRVHMSYLVANYLIAIGLRGVSVRELFIETANRYTGQTHHLMDDEGELSERLVYNPDVIRYTLPPDHRLVMSTPNGRSWLLDDYVRRTARSYAVRNYYGTPI